jgi:hypothetical protein
MTKSDGFTPDKALADKSLKKPSKEGTLKYVVNNTD